MKNGKILFSLVFTLACAWAGAQTIPVLPAGGKQVRVKNTAELAAAIKGAVKGQTILLADGTYDVSAVEPLRIRADSMSLYGESRKPDKVILKGKGFKSANTDEEMITVEANRPTFAYLTIRDVRANGIKLQGANHDVLVHNVYFIDICERSIKSTDLATAKNGTVQYCLFQQVTPVTSAIPNLKYNGDYIAGMDMMSIDGWNIHDNAFKNIRGMNGLGRAGVFLWRGCKNVTVERNSFIGCDRSIAFGNSGGAASDMQGGIMRNNFIVAGAGNTLEICNASNSLIANNTIYSANPAYRQTVYFYKAGSGNVFKNNLILGKFFLQVGAVPDTSKNLFLGSASGWFVNAANGDLHLTASATGAIGKGAVLPQVSKDFDNAARDSKPDIGADEYASSGSSGPAQGVTGVLDRGVSMPTIGAQGVSAGTILFRAKYNALGRAALKP